MDAIKKHFKSLLSRPDFFSCFSRYRRLAAFLVILLSKHVHSILDLELSTSRELLPFLPEQWFVPVLK